MILTIDIDGVLAGGEYIPEWERIPERYLSLPLLEPDLPNTIHKLARKHSLYLLSSRKFDHALDYTRLWLEQSGFAMTDFCGVMVGLNPQRKRIIFDLLHADYHIDDDYRMKELIPNRFIFVYHENAKSHYPWSDKAAGYYDIEYALNWKEINTLIDLSLSRDAAALLSAPRGIGGGLGESPTTGEVEPSSLPKVFVGGDLP